MDSYRILIGSGDPSYDRALTRYLARRCPALQVTCLEPDRWWEEPSEALDGYDRILLGDSLKNLYEGPARRSLPERGWTGEEVLRALLSGGPEEEVPRFRTRTVGIWWEEDPACREGLFFLLKTLSGQGEKILYADLRRMGESPPEPSLREPQRSWDDLLYSALYARSPDLIRFPEQSGCVGESGLCWFPPIPSLNPYHSLSPEEIRRFFGRIGEYSDRDYLMVSLPEEDSGVFAQTLGQMQLILLFCGDSDRGQRRLPETVHRFRETCESPPDMLEICTGSRWQGEEAVGLPLRLSDPPEETRRDCLKITELMEHECFI